MSSGIVITNLGKPATLVGLAVMSSIKARLKQARCLRIGMAGFTIPKPNCHLKVDIPNKLGNCRISPT
jgi:hypothetical protein